MLNNNWAYTNAHSSFIHNNKIWINPNNFQQYKAKHMTSIPCNICCFLVVKSYPTFGTLWTAACQPSLSFTISQSCSNSCPLSWWCQPTISSSVTLFSCPHLSQHQSLFQWVSSSHQVAKASASVLPKNEYSGLISFRINWFDLLAVQGILESSPAQQSESINSSALSLLYSPTRIFASDYWTNHSFDYMDLCQQNDVSAFEYSV